MAGTIRMKTVLRSDLRYKPLYPADLLKFEVPQTMLSIRTAEDGRVQIANIIHQRDDRLLVIVGPRFIRNPRSALSHAKLLRQASLRYETELQIVMRCYVDKPQAVDGWSGFLNDPLLDGSFDINQGLHLTRQLFIDITQTGLPIATELLGSLSQAYFTDLISVNLAAARLNESPLHRELASSVQCPVGFAATSAVDLEAVMHAVYAASTEHHYISATPEGRTAIAWTPGNENCFVVVQADLPDTSPCEDVVSSTVNHLLNMQISPVVVIDCSQGEHSPERQSKAVHRVCSQIMTGERGIVGIVLDSCLPDGCCEQPQSTPYGIAAGDCKDWDATMSALDILATAVRKRRNAGCAVS